jgi:asparaginyl-tRNA synthetase
MATIHIDEAGGSDSTGDGTAEAPFHSILGALLKQGSAEAPPMVCKQADPAEYVPVTATALKRAKKAYEIHVKKAAKQQQNNSDQQQKQAQDESKLEESRKIVIQETEGEAKRIKIHQAIHNRQTKVRLFGWVHRLRQQKGLIFIILRDGTGFLQCVLTGKLVSSLLSFFEKRRR